MTKKLTNTDEPDKTLVAKQWLTNKKGIILGIISAALTITGYENLPVGQIIKAVINLLGGQ